MILLWGASWLSLPLPRAASIRSSIRFDIHPSVDDSDDQDWNHQIWITWRSSDGYEEGRRALSQVLWVETRLRHFWTSPLHRSPLGLGRSPPLPVSHTDTHTHTHTSVTGTDTDAGTDVAAWTSWKKHNKNTLKAQSLASWWRKVLLSHHTSYRQQCRVLMISNCDYFSSTNVNVNLTDEEKWLQLPASCFVYRTDDIFALHVYVL